MRRHAASATLAALALVATAVTAGVGAQTTTTSTPSATILHDGDRLTVESAPSQQLRGETTLPAGTRLTLRIQSSDASSPFLRRVEATVTDDGRFAATTDFSDVAPDTAFTVTVRYNAATIAETSGRIVACTGGCTQTASDTDRATTTFSTEKAGFGRAVVQVRQGERVEIPVTVGDRGQVVLSIDDEETNYRLNATLTEGNGDGRVVTVFDTTAVGQDGAVLTPADDADSVTVDTSTEGVDELDPTEYDLTLRTVGGQQRRIAVGTLILRAGLSTGTMTETTVSGPATSTAPLDDSTPTGANGIDLGGLGALSVGLVLGVVGIALLLGLLRN